jgi:hypothetical protein
MYKTWHMTTMGGSNLTSNATFSVDFVQSDPSDPSSPFNVRFTFQDSSTLWGTLDSSSITAAVSSTNPATAVTGTTSSGQPFHIEPTDTTLSCFLDGADNLRLRLFSRHRWLAAVLEVGVGTLVGGAVGLAAGSPRLGAVAGLTGATTALFARDTTTDGQFQSGGSSPTWVANGPDGRIIGKPGPHSVVRATA